MDLHWSRNKQPDGSTLWEARPSPTGSVVAQAINTSATGTDNYPWDWMFTEAGKRILRERGNLPRRTGGVEDTLRSVKQLVGHWFALAPASEQ